MTAEWDRSNRITTPSKKVFDWFQTCRTVHVISNVSSYDSNYS